MITQRTNPRTTVCHWLMEIARTANAEKAEHSLARLQELASPILAMTAASEAADPELMKALLGKDSFKVRAVRYMDNNAFVGLGLPPVAGLAAKISYADRSLNFAEAAIATLEGLRLEAGDLTGKRLSDKLDEASARMPKAYPNSVEGIDDDLATLLREVVGLPGDAYACELITDPAVLANAGHALRRLGADVTPEAFANLGVEDPDGQSHSEILQP